MSQRTTFHAETPLQALLLEQALLLAKQLEATADAAPDGQVLAKVEALAVGAARELARQAVQATLQAQAAAAEKNQDGKLDWRPPEFLGFRIGVLESTCPETQGNRSRPVEF